MSTAIKKLEALKTKKAQLETQEKKLIEQRKKEIGELAEQLGILSIPNALLQSVWEDGVKSGRFHKKAEASSLSD